jgi:hypothetical protein
MTRTSKPGAAAPQIEWETPLKPCGPENNPKSYLLGTVRIFGASFHAEAYQVRNHGRTQVAAVAEHDTNLENILAVVDDAAQTVRIGRREYVLAITPYQR